MSAALTNLTEFQLTQRLDSGKALRIGTKLLPSVCRCCQFYKFQGHSGGYCQQLGVPVRSAWRSCSLALPPFAPSWEGP
ncbi:MAG TPA: hypothetical protein DDZ80_17705 [Cyanobacteria bacterium UBA8803]|nr:hypothetical protein [Cyanobacteria bacterium UBA9273]HBL60221.1 hypothetical protein [Cyanobacteria bacterium UBA8803]